MHAKGYASVTSLIGFDISALLASDKALGLELLDMDERFMDHGVLQQAQAGIGAGNALDDGDMHPTWEFLLISNSQGLENGGMAGLFWSFVWTFIGFGFIIASLSEMASMAPTSGGQYHWVSEFSPPRYQKFLSYITGWMSVLAWQAGSASGSFLTGTIIQGLISIRNPDYTPENWQGTLFVFAMILVIYVFNVYASNLMPILNNLLMILHILSWVVIVIVLWTMAPHQSAKTVFTHWENLGGWSSMGLSVMIGQISAIYASLSMYQAAKKFQLANAEHAGSDATAHMSEEVKDASRSVPIAIALGYFSNGIMAIVLLIAYLAIPSVEDALNDNTGFPFLYVFQNAVSTAGVNGLTAIILLPVIFSNIFFNASTSRQTFAFARDKGLPCSKWISKVDSKRKIPVNAIALSCIISCLLSLINIGSLTAFNAIISLNVAALMYTYIISISCVIYRKIWHAETLPPRRWDMGRWGLPVNIIDNFNWSVVIFGGVFIISLGMYLFKGRKEYVGPAVIISRLQD
ncbi:hypothetical protein PENOC_102330 [Penicillium occitanis (nom. inval.)]|nr:hypothetical protein PENOC_102330 [Penicillium occitanis (nom. inval.)]